MFFPSRSFLGVALLLLPALAVAQSEPAASSPHEATMSPQRAAEVLPAVLPVVPIHDEQTVDGRREVWTAGPDFKASFHDGFAFYPRGGPDRPRAFRWRTVAVEVGGQALIPTDSAPEPSYTTERCEFDHGVVVEAYQVREDGVEQTFTLAELPPVAGDLVVRGRVAGDFAAPRTRVDVQQALEFTGDEAPGVRYGEAMAVDAAGHRTPMTTSFDGTHVTLRLEGAWLAAAHYPIVVDPLTTARGLSSYTGPSRPWRDVAVSYDPYADQYLVLATLDAPGDPDVYGYLCNRDFTSSDLVYAFTGTDAMRARDVGFVAAPRRWLVLVDRRFGVANYFGLHARDSGSTALASVALTLSSPTRTKFYPARIGGTTRSSTGRRALVAYGDDGSTGWSTRYGCFYVDVFSSGVWAGSPFPILPSRYHAFRDLDVTQSGSSSDPWVVAVGEYNGAGLALVPQTSGWATRTMHLPDSRVDGVRVAGSRGNGVIAWGRRGEIAARKLSWSSSQLNWGAGGVWTQPGPGLRLLGAAMDERTRSHWALLYERFDWAASRVDLEAVRLGHSLGVVETQRLQLRWNVRRHHGDVTYGVGEGAFGFAYSYDGDSAQQVRGRRLVHDPAGGTTVYGSGCGPAALSANQYQAGNANFSVWAWSLPPGIPVTITGSMGRASFPLPGGCTQLIDPGQVFLSSMATTGVWGYTSVSYPLPDDPVLIGDLFFQVLYLDGGVQRASSGLEVRVRP